MRIGLADVKKRISRTDGELLVTPHLLGPRQHTRELEALIALYEAYVGKDRAGFPADRPAELIGDYRVARCLAICLSDWYEWRPVAWPGAASTAEAEALAAAGIDDPSRLRLALYDWVNAAGAGYLISADRDTALDAFAADLGIARHTLDDLLWLDAEERAVLTRTAEGTPSPRALALRYNQQVFEALLCNASQVELTIPGPAERADLPQGALVKRICFLARTFGVQYDVTFADAAPALASEAPAEPDDAHRLRRVAETRGLYAVPADPAQHDMRGAPQGRDIAVTLFGPLEVTGAPQQYGERLARLCRALLGYRRADASSSGLALAAVSGAARVYVRGRPMRLRLDEHLLRLVSPAAPPGMSGLDDSAQAQPAFDSGVEADFFAEFAALERAGEVRGWRLEREPEPVIVGSTILVPDFALSRGPRRVYLEIAGYWRPEYRERKVRKLLAAAGTIDFLVAVPRSAYDAFIALEGQMPMLWYASSPHTSALLDLLDAAFDDFDQRLSSLDLPRIAREVQDRGHLSPVEGMSVLRCYSRAELARVLDAWAVKCPSSGEQRPLWVEDVGLCSPAWLANMASRVLRLVEAAPRSRMSLADVGGALATDQPPLALSGRGVEALAGMAGLAIARSSLFAAEVLAPDAPSDEPLDPVAGADSGAQAASVQHGRQPRRQRQRKTPQNAPVAQPLFPAE